MESHSHSHSLAAEETQIDASVQGMVKFLAKGQDLQLLHPDDVNDEPDVAAEDFVHPVVSIWARKNIPNN